MKESNQKRLLLNLLENSPSIAFLSLLQVSNDLRLAGWAGAFFATLTIAAYVTRRLAPGSILLGVNLYMLAITPAIEVLYVLDFYGAGAFVREYAHIGVFVAIFVAGCLQTAFSPLGFLGACCSHKSTARKYSGLLLVFSFGAVIWAITVDADRLLKFGIPFLVLFGLRQMLVARIVDQQAKTSKLPAVALALSGAEQSDIGNLV